MEPKGRSSDKQRKVNQERKWQITTGSGDSLLVTFQRAILIQYARAEAGGQCAEE